MVILRAVDAIGIASGAFQQLADTPVVNAAVVSAIRILSLMPEGLLIRIGAFPMRIFLDGNVKRAPVQAFSKGSRRD